ncbi:MAG: DUF167 domain-containing protein [Gammaproteobacteria bacterium]|nr:DUF167 domain-containing protein [Gammaproteobacteria bacterium]
MDKFYQWEGDDLRLNILGTPGAKQTKIGKVRGNQLKVSVSCAAEKGKATACMIKFLAEQFKVKESDITLVFGLTSINKQFLIETPKRLPDIIKS